MSGNLWWSASKAIKPILRKNPDTLSAARREAVQLFRLMAKEVPRVSNLYDVPMPDNVIRRRLANAFRKNADVKDPRVVHLMVQKGYMELEETLQQFKQKSHLMNLLEANKHVKKPEKDFLERFYEGSL
eukprot:g3216.t1